MTTKDPKSEGRTDPKKAPSKSPPAPAAKSQPPPAPAAAPKGAAPRPLAVPRPGGPSIPRPARSAGGMTPRAPVVTAKSPSADAPKVTDAPKTPAVAATDSSAPEVTVLPTPVPTPAPPAHAPVAAPLGPTPEALALRRLTAKMEGLPHATLQKPAADPKTCAQAALMVAHFVAEDANKGRFVSMVQAGLLEAEAIDDLPVLARFILRIVPKLGGDMRERAALVPADLDHACRSLRDELLRTAERHLTDIDEAHGRIVTVRLGATPAELVEDLRMLADLCRDYAEPLQKEAKDYTPEISDRARQMADRLEASLLTGETAEEAQWREHLLRAWCLLVPTYEEVCRAGRFLFHKDKPEARFPSLSAVLRVRRRIRKETARRSGAMAAASPASGDRPSLRPGGKHSVPELRLSLPPQPLLDEDVQIVDTGEVPAIIPGPARMPRPPTLPSVPGMPAMPAVPAFRGAGTPDAEVEVMESALDVSANAESIAPADDPFPGGGGGEEEIEELAFGEDVSMDAEGAALDIEVAFDSDSNFYAGLADAPTDVGLFVATYITRPAGTRLNIALSLEDRAPIHVTGVVRWIREFSPSIEAPPGMGVQLEGVTDGDLKVIRRFMAQRPPFFYDE